MQHITIEEVQAQYPDAIEYLIDAQKDIDECNGTPELTDVELITKIRSDNCFYIDGGVLMSQFNDQFNDGCATVATWIPASKKGRRPGYWEVNVSEY